MTQLEQALKLLQITRVAVPRHRLAEISNHMADECAGREMWFSADGTPIGFWAPEEGLAALKRCVAYVERERSA